MYRFYLSPATLEEALRLKAEYRERARVIAGGTDLLIELDRGTRTAPDGGELGLIDLTRIPGLGEIREQDGRIRLGPLVTHNQCVASPLIVQRAFPLARACWEVGSPQIRNRATVAGNLITASPANDTIVPLMALDATVTLTSAARGARELPLHTFYTGFRQVDLAPDEILTAIHFAPLAANQEGAFVKLGLRRAQAISVLSVAVVITWEEQEGSERRVAGAAISLGAVAPVVVRAAAAEQSLVGQPLNDATIDAAAQLAQEAASPIDDIRATAAYRRAMVTALTARALRLIRNGQARSGWLEQPVMLWGKTGGVWPVAAPTGAGPAMEALVNGKPVRLAGGMTLLDSLRQAGYVGVKEGCAEGECGACTVFLDGMAIMACLAPSERAAGSQVITVEGLGNPPQLHPVQAALVQSGGVQCGYCTPGFVMSAAKLLEERPQPTRREAQEALTGNFCRCTGYRKILDAIVMAGHRAQTARPD
ncbi:MAG TPA: FAD binding domain-containing protein [Caldilineaceae bacterium]|nr:FAD binding domain-containing protein [Caldilineaceae bacterium]